MAQTLHIYCDESRQTKERYMVLGGIILDRIMVPVFKNAVNEYRQQYGMVREMKWGKVSNGKLTEYKRFVDVFFRFHKANKANFHALIIDSHSVDHGRFGADEEVGFYKFYYQLLLHSFGRYCFKDEKLLAFLDYRMSSYSLNTLKTILNRGIKKSFGIPTAPFRAIEPCHSHDCELIQAVDLLIGAIGYLKNRCHEAQLASPAKREMCDYIKRMCGLKSLTESSPRHLKRFNVWDFKFKKK